MIHVLNVERRGFVEARRYGIGEVAVFKSFLQTLGTFDGTGAPKLSRTVFTRELAR